MRWIRGYSRCPLSNLACLVFIVPLLTPQILLAYPRDWNQTIASEAHFDVDPGGKLVVEVADANVVLQPGSPGKVDVEVEVASHDLDRALERYRDMEFSIEAHGNTVTVHAAKPHSRWRWRYSSYVITVKVSLPEDFNVDIETDDGDINVAALEGNLLLHTSDGDIHIGQANSPRVRIDTSDGNITLGEIRGPDVQIETSDGKIQAAGLWGADIDIRTGDGDILIDALSGGLNAMTNDGNIHVRIDDLASTTLRSADGDITVIAATTLAANVDLHGEDLFLRQTDLNFDGSLSEHRARGKLNGGGPRLQANARDGSITLSTRR